MQQPFADRLASPLTPGDASRILLESSREFALTN
jgi:hypothetical protein